MTKGMVFFIRFHSCFYLSFLIRAYPPYPRHPRSILIGWLSTARPPLTATAPPPVDTPVGLMYDPDLLSLPYPNVR
jgi:hypothetical protein